MSAVLSPVRGAIVAVASMVIAGGQATAGGMPSDEGPEVVLDQVGYDDAGPPGEATITAIIKSEIPDYVDAAWAGDDAAGAVAELELPPAFKLPPGGVVTGR